MKADKFLWSAAVLAFVSMSEADLGRPKKTSVAGPPVVKYMMKKPSKIAEAVRDDLNKGFRVASQLTELEMKDIITKLEPLLSTRSMNFKHPDKDIIEWGFEILRLEVPDRVFPVRHAFYHQDGSNSMILVIIIPKIIADIRSRNCQQRTGPMLDCNAVYSFENVQVALKVHWRPLGQKQDIQYASITNFEPDTIKYELIFGYETLPMEIFRKGSLSWKYIMAKTKAIVPNVLQIHDLETIFAKRIFT